MKALAFLKIITVVNLLVATGFSVAGIISPASILPVNITSDKEITIFALYAAARTIPLAIIAIAFIFNKHWNALITFASLCGVIQMLDGFIGVYQNDASKSIAPFIIAAIEFIAIYLALKKTNQG